MLKIPSTQGEASTAKSTEPGSGSTTGLCLAAATHFSVLSYAPDFLWRGLTTEHGHPPRCPEGLTWGHAGMGDVGPD